MYTFSIESSKAITTDAIMRKQDYLLDVIPQGQYSLVCHKMFAFSAGETCFLYTFRSRQFLYDHHSQALRYLVSDLWKDKMFKFRISV